MAHKIRLNGVTDYFSGMHVAPHHLPADAWDGPGVLVTYYGHTYHGVVKATSGRTHLWVLFRKKYQRRPGDGSATIARVPVRSCELRHEGLRRAMEILTGSPGDYRTLANAYVKNGRRSSPTIFADDWRLVLLADAMDRHYYRLGVKYDAGPKAGQHVRVFRAGRLPESLKKWRGAA